MTEAWPAKSIFVTGTGYAPEKQLHCRYLLFCLLSDSLHNVNSNLNFCATQQLLLNRIEKAISTENDVEGSGVGIPEIRIYRKVVAIPRLTFQCYK